MRHDRREVSGRAVTVLRWIAYMELVCEIQPSPSAALGLQLAGQYAVGDAVLRQLGFRFSC